jgi:hypothetical protein
MIFYKNIFIEFIHYSLNKYNHIIIQKLNFFNKKAVILKIYTVLNNYIHILIKN